MSRRSERVTAAVARWRLDIEHVFLYTGAVLQSGVIRMCQSLAAQFVEAASMYMMWFDDNNKKPVARKIEEAVAAYVRHFKTRPNVVLVNEADQVGCVSI